MMLTAHSGSDGTPDNSRQFIKEMLQAGIACVEVDVRRSQEGSLYLSHDKTLWAEAMLSLDNAFQILKTDSEAFMNCDLKEQNLEQAVITLATEHNLQDRIILSGAVNLDNLPDQTYLKQVYYNAESIIPHLYLNWEMTKAQINEVVQFCHEKGLETININYRLATNGVINRFHQEGLSLSVWTVNEFAEINRFRSANIKNVTTKYAISYLYQNVVRQAMGG